MSSSRSSFGSSNKSSFGDLFRRSFGNSSITSVGESSRTSFRDPSRCFFWNRFKYSIEITPEVLLRNHPGVSSGVPSRELSVFPSVIPLGALWNSSSNSTIISSGISQKVASEITPGIFEGISYGVSLEIPPAVSLGFSSGVPFLGFIQEFFVNSSKYFSGTSLEDICENFQGVSSAISTDVAPKCLHEFF